MQQGAFSVQNAPIERLHQLQLDGTQSTGCEPVVTGRKLVVTQTDPVATGREPVATETDPVATGREPVATRTITIATDTVGAFSIQNAQGCIITIIYTHTETASKNHHELNESPLIITQKRNEDET
jgi:uncharacterized Zn-binding protein involved in type VI secretion